MSDLAIERSDATDAKRTHQEVSLSGEGVSAGPEYPVLPFLVMLYTTCAAGVYRGAVCEAYRAMVEFESVVCPDESWGVLSSWTVCASLYELAADRYLGSPRSMMGVLSGLRDTLRSAMVCIATKECPRVWKSGRFWLKYRPGAYVPIVSEYLVAADSYTGQFDVASVLSWFRIHSILHGCEAMDGLPFRQLGHDEHSAAARRSMETVVTGNFPEGYCWRRATFRWNEGNRPSMGGDGRAADAYRTVEDLCKSRGVNKFARVRFVSDGMYHVLAPGEQKCNPSTLFLGQLDAHDRLGGLGGRGGPAVTQSMRGASRVARWRHNNHGPPNVGVMTQDAVVGQPSTLTSVVMSWDKRGVCDVACGVVVDNALHVTMAFAPAQGVVYLVWPGGAVESIDGCDVPVGHAAVVCFQGDGKYSRARKVEGGEPRPSFWAVRDDTGTLSPDDAVAALYLPVEAKL